MNLRPVAASVLTLTLICTAALASAKEMATKWPFAFVDQFPENVEELGWPSGTRLTIGVFVIHGDSPVKSVAVKNLNSGVTLEVQSGEPVSGLFSAEESPPILYVVFPAPLFDPEKHSGVWEVIVTDEGGNTVVDYTHDLDKAAQLPSVTDVSASGERLTPTVTWQEPDLQSIPDWCRKEYRVRLLKDAETQLHRSKPLTEAKYEVPEGILKDEDFVDIYVRVELSCYDNEDKEHTVPLESRSEKFELLKDVLE